QALTRSVVAAQTARAYVLLRALDRDEAALKDTLATREGVLSLQRKRLDAGLINAYDLALVEAERNGVTALLPAVTAAREQAEIALAALVGRDPAALVTRDTPRGSEVAALAGAPSVPAGLPSDLMLRRPDIAVAEQLLYATHASVNEARARWFPSI